MQPILPSSQAPFVIPSQAPSVLHSQLLPQASPTPASCVVSTVAKLKPTKQESTNKELNSKLDSQVKSIKKLFPTSSSLASESTIKSKLETNGSDEFNIDIASDSPLSELFRVDNSDEFPSFDQTTDIVDLRLSNYTIPAFVPLKPNNPSIDLLRRYTPVRSTELDLNSLNHLAQRVSLYAKCQAIVVRKIFKDKFIELSKCSFKEENDLIFRIVSLSKNESIVYTSYPYQSTQLRLKSAKLKMRFFSGLMHLQIDNFFTNKESAELRGVGEFSRTSEISFPVNNISLMSGEKPPKIMSEDDRLQLFKQPPAALDAVHKLFSFFGSALNVDISTVPWGLVSCGNNFAISIDKVSEDVGWHLDYDPSKGLPFAISKRYNEEYYSSVFDNGSANSPLMLTVLVYTAAENFKTEWGMGTRFQDLHGVKTTVECEHMRMVIFECNISHSIQQSFIPPGIKTWRNSFVYKIILRRRKESDEGVSIKAQFERFIEENYGSSGKSVRRVG
jgi:hypothetical protein